MKRLAFLALLAGLIIGQAPGQVTPILADNTIYTNALVDSVFIAANGRGVQIDIAHDSGTGTVYFFHKNDTTNAHAFAILKPGEKNSFTTMAGWIRRRATVISHVRTNIR